VQPEETRVLELVARTAATVPAYRAFLAESGIDAASVTTIAAFKQLPLMTRDRYIRRYPLGERCRGGNLASCDMICVSSGSTGEPTFWPRTQADELAIAPRFEDVLVRAFSADKKKTLAVVCFPLGTWVGGMFTTSCCRLVAAKGYPITTVTPGNQRTEILRVVRALAPMFEQTVLLGYPPFLKDVVDAGISEGLPWQAFGVKLVLAGEVFSEAWRSLMGERLGLARLPFESASLYGTADAGVIGNETPLSVSIRRFLADRSDAAQRILGKTRLPTLVQYDPSVRYLETHEGTLVVSGDGGVPLVRYHIADDGGLIPYETLIAAMTDLGFSAKEVEGGRLPFAFVFGRSHFAVSYYGANIFPEMVSLALEQSNLAPHVTGKFVMEVIETVDRDRQLTIAVELSSRTEASNPLRDSVADEILQQLLVQNSEFGSYVPEPRQRPLVTLWPMAHPDYFPTGVKHRYSRG